MQEILDSLQLSIIRQLNEKCGPKTITLALGEPNLPLTPEQTSLLTAQFAESITTYTDTDGLKSLKARLVEQAEKEFNKKGLFACVTAGTQQSLFMCLGAATNPDDEIIIITPHYPSYEALARLYRLKPVFVERGIDGRLPVEAIRQSVTAKTRILLLNSPNNPTGSVDSKEDLEKLRDLIEGGNFLTLSDEVYYGFSEEPLFSPFHFKKVVLIRGISKTYGLTGFRLAWVITEDKTLAGNIKKYQQNINTCPNTLVQHFVYHLLENDLGRQKDLNHLYLHGRQRVLGFCSRLGLKHYPQKGSFYTFISLDQTPYAARAFDFATDLLNQKDVLVVPAKAFHKEDHFFRVNVLVEAEKMNLALNAIEFMLKS